MTTTDSSYDVRAELEDLLERDLLGPWDGPDEELPPGTPPAERYLLGRLVPMRSSRRLDAVPAGEGDDPDLTDREVVDAPDDPEAPVPQATVRSGTMSASAMGLTFSVPSAVDALKVTAEWGRYERGPSELHQTSKTGRPWCGAAARSPAPVTSRSPTTGTRR